MKSLLCGVLALWSAMAVAAPEPAQVVERFHATLVDNMKKGAQLDCAARENVLAPVVQDSFDTAFLARFVLRKHWPQLSDAQKSRFIEALQRVVVSSYADNFKSFGGESFVTLETADGATGQKTVRTQLKRPSGDPVSFDYVMRQDGGAWKIFNVVAEGVSDLALRSAQYEKLFAAQGFDALVAWIESQTRNDGC